MAISMQDIHELQKRGPLHKDELILDIRTPEEFEEGHVPGATNLSHELVPDHLDELRRYQKIYLYCHSGGRVRWACEMLSHLGLKNAVGVENGGMPDWLDAGYPVEHGRGSGSIESGGANDPSKKG